MPRMMERVLALASSWEKGGEIVNPIIFGFSMRSSVSYRWGVQHCVTVDISFVISLLVSHSVRIWKINQTRINSEKSRKIRLFGARFTHVWNSYQRCYIIVFLNSMLIITCKSSVSWASLITKAKVHFWKDLWTDGCCDCVGGSNSTGIPPLVINNDSKRNTISL